MTNQDKDNLRRLCRMGLSFKKIKWWDCHCSDQTIKKYMKQFSPATTEEK